MLTFTIASFILTIIVTITAGLIFGLWIVLSEEEREKKKKK